MVFLEKACVVEFLKHGDAFFKGNGGVDPWPLPACTHMMQIIAGQGFEPSTPIKSFQSHP